MEFYTYKALCTKVVDGDTIDLEVDLGFGSFIRERFRLSRINAPETYGISKESEEYKAGLLSKTRLQELIENKQVIIKTEKDRREKYGRYLAEVFINDLNINDLLLQEGLAQKY